MYFGECRWPVAFERTYSQGLTHSRSWDIWIDVHVVFRWFQPYRDLDLIGTLRANRVQPWVYMMFTLTVCVETCHWILFRSNSDHISRFWGKNHYQQTVEIDKIWIFDLAWMVVNFKNRKIICTPTA